jgi:hypothetical protein
LYITRGSRNSEQTAPDAEASQRVVNRGLCEQTFGLRHFIDISEARLISRRSLL